MVNTAGKGVVLTGFYLVDGPEIQPVTRYLVKETADFSRCPGKNAWRRKPLCPRVQESLTEAAAYQKRWKEVRWEVGPAWREDSRSPEL